MREQIKEPRAVAGWGGDRQHRLLPPGRDGPGPWAETSPAPGTTWALWSQLLSAQSTGLWGLAQASPVPAVWLFPGNSWQDEHHPSECPQACPGTALGAAGMVSMWRKSRMNVGTGSRAGLSQLSSPHHSLWVNSPNIISLLCLHPFGGSCTGYKTRPVSPGDFEFEVILGSLWILHTVCKSH